MEISKQNGGITWVTREDGVQFMIVKDIRRNVYYVFAKGVDTGYKFNSFKKALQYCETGY